MTPKPPEKVTTVLVPIMMQDPSVLHAADWQASATHPSGARCATGFADGPACERVAVVDVDVETGILRPPARLLTPAEANVYRNVGGYDVKPPTKKGRREVWQRLEQGHTELRRMEGEDFLNDPFLKVSCFGTVLRTIGLMEGPVGLARRTEWAFDGTQLLVVPAAGLRENAFYDRDSGSLRFYYFDPDDGEGQRVYTALSQDVVVHETAHAVIDAAAPDLYHATDPESLAIHEGLADITAALISMLNREFQRDKGARREERFIEDLSRSSRFSRFAEQFGARARGGTTLRELMNDRRLGDDTADPDVVDIASPHAVSEVLSGALFGVLRQSILEASDDPIFRREDKGGRTGLAVATAGRIASLAYKGLDWLPPGDVSIADLGRALLAADRFQLPEHDRERELLVAELVRRGVADAGQLDKAPDADAVGPVDFAALCSSQATARAFVNQHRALFGIDPGVGFERPRVRMHRSRSSEIRGWTSGDTMANLDGPVRPVTAENAELLLIQVGWWTSQPNEWSRALGATREVKTGATLAVDSEGRVHTLLRGGQEHEQSRRRDAFLTRLARTGMLLGPHEGVGPDGAPLAGYVHSVAHAGGMRFTGGLRALHLIEEAP